MLKQDRESLMALNVDAKLVKAKEIIKQALTEFESDLVIAWTGGKDSTTMLWIYKEVCAEMGVPLPSCIFINEGDVFDEINALVEQVKNLWSVTVYELKNRDVLSKVNNLGDYISVAELNDRNRAELDAIGVSDREFPFEPESYIGNHLMKTVPLKMFIEENGIRAVSTAIRWDEQEARKEEIFFSKRENPEHTRVQPILHFRERDIWTAVHKYKYPYCSLYEIGYRSLGARCSTHKNSDLPAWEQDLENTPERVGRGQDKEMIMSQLRDLGYM